MSPRLAFAIEVALRAGRSTLAHFQTGAEVKTKSDLSPVTAADLEAERIMRSKIEKAYPREGLLGEEHGEKGGQSERWVMDPIDGTKSFVCGVPLFATLLSFEREAQPELAVCYFPALNELLYAERGYGSFWNGRPARVSATAELEEAALSCGSHASMHARGVLDQFLRLAKCARSARTWSDAYGHALVATGRIEAMIDPYVKHWDISAMSLLVEEAGGRFTDLKGRPGIHAEALSTNQALHGLLVEALAS